MTTRKPSRTPNTDARVGKGPLEDRRDKAVLHGIEQYRTRPERPDVTFNENGQLSRSVDEHVQHCDVMGTSLYAFAGMQLCRLAEVVIKPDQTPDSDPTDASNRTAAALAIVAAVEPRNELEAALGVQMAATHELAMDMLCRARRSDRIDHMAQYGSLAVKMQRTFAGHVEALAKLRTAGKQIVEVNHVHTYVGAGGQAIIGDVHHGGGGGPQSAITGQPHALAGLAHDPGAPMPGQDAERTTVSIASGEGPEAMPDARRRQPRRAPRREKRSV